MDDDPLLASDDPSQAPVGHLARTFSAFRSPNYRIWFRGQLLSLFGTWMEATAQGFLVFELTRSPSALGLVGFAAGAPTWFFTLFGGVIADRVDRRRIMIATQSCMMALSFLLSALTFIGWVRAWHVMGLALMLGIANAFDAPARQAFVSELVPRSDLTNAIALNATMFNTATALGPAVAGVVYALLGPAWCFALNGVSFIAVIVSLTRMKLPPFVPRPRSSSTFAEVKEGLRYVATHSTIRTLISLVALTSLFALSISTLIPAWTVNILNGHAAENGLLLSARGVGSLAGSLFIAYIGHRLVRGRLLLAGALFYPLLLMGFAMSRWIPLSVIMLAGVGMGTILVLNLANAIVQTTTPDHLRGRVMGAYTWIFFGFMPLGALWTGLVAEHLSEPAAVLINAAAALITAVTVSIFFRHRLAAT